MVKRIQWDIYEAVLLVDTYFELKRIEFDRKYVVEMLSHELRDKAIYAGIDIDAVFRNMNGINMRLYELLYIDTDGEKGMKNTSKLFKYTMELYRKCSEYFEDICSEAYRMVEPNEQLQSFLLWLKQDEKKYNIGEIRMALRILNYFEGIGKMPYGRFASITDISMVENVRDTVIDKNTLNLHMSVINNINKLIDVYEVFLKLNNRNGDGGGVDSMEKDNEEKEKKFPSWLIDDLHLADTTACGYSSAINATMSYTEKTCDIDTSLYGVYNDDKFQQYGKAMNRTGDDKSFCKKNDEESFENVEDIIREADIDGITANAISNKIGKSIWLVNKYLKDKKYAIEVPRSLYIHADNIIDLFESKDALEKILRNQFNKFYGYTNDIVLYDAASISMCMFLNDNCIDCPEKIYAVVRYLFEKVEKVFEFSADKHIWEKPSKFSSTHAGIVMSFIDKNGGIASKSQCRDYLQKVKLPLGNINGILSVANGKDVLLSENEEYVLAEYIMENNEWLDRVKVAIEKLLKTPYILFPER